MKAEIIAVGTELLLGQIANTNAQFISERFAFEGIDIHFHQVVGDNLARIKRTIQIAVERADILVFIGGLGPTEDDLTRESVAEFLGRPLILNEFELNRLKEIFHSLNKVMTKNNIKQAHGIQGSEFLPNPRGTAPGQYIQVHEKHFFLLPGPPLEMKTMVDNEVLPRIRTMAMSETILSRQLKICGIGESDLETRISDILAVQGNPTIAPYASEGEAKLRITAKAHTEEEASHLIADIEKKLRARLEPYIYGVNDETLPDKVAEKLKGKGHKIAIAECGTGGVLTSMLSEIPQNSQFLLQGWVVTHESLKSICSTSNPKQEQLISESENAVQLAEYIRDKAKSDWVIGVYGLEKFNKETTEFSSEEVWFAILSDAGVKTYSYHFRGSYKQLCIRASKHALHLLLTVMKDTQGESCNRQ